MYTYTPLEHGAQRRYSVPGSRRGPGRSEAEYSLPKALRTSRHAPEGRDGTIERAGAPGESVPQPWNCGAHPPLKKRKRVVHNHAQGASSGSLGGSDSADATAHPTVPKGGWQSSPSAAAGYPQPLGAHIRARVSEHEALRGASGPSAGRPWLHRMRAATCDARAARRARMETTREPRGAPDDVDLSRKLISKLACMLAAGFEGRCAR